MPVVKLQKIGIVGFKGERERLLKFLQEEEMIHILDLREIMEEEEVYKDYLQPSSSAPEELEEKLYLIDSALRILEEFQPSKGIQGLLEGLLPTRILISEEKLEERVKSFDYWKVIEGITEAKKQISGIEEKIKTLKAEHQTLSPFSSLKIPFNKILPSKYTSLTYIRINTSHKEKIVDLFAPLEVVHIEEIGREGNNLYIILFFHREKEEEVKEIIRREGIEEFSPPSLDKLPRERLKEIEGEIKKLEEEKEKVLEKARKFLPYKEDLMLCYDYYLFQWEREKSKNLVGESDLTFFLQGWVKEKDYPHIKRWIESKFPQVWIEKLPLKKGEEPPVEIENHPIFRPFEAITRLYSVPRYEEVDPSPLLAPFFAAFFGLCLTDAGYGILLILLTLVLLKKLTVGKEILKVILLGGVATVFWGVITGGWFGISPDTLPPFLKKFILFDPLKDLMTLFILSLCLGITHILFGIGIELYKKIRQGKILQALGENLSWLMIIPGLLLAFLTRENNPSLSRMGTYLLLGGAIISFLPCFKRGENPLLKMIFIVGGFLWKAKDFLGNVLSYSRLMALGLATSVIALVVNTIAGITRAIPIVGIVATVVVLIGGHLFNLAINMLGAFVHTSRLQFVEFFPYFFQGGGREFRPLSREGKYTLITTRR